MACLILSLVMDCVFQPHLNSPLLLDTLCSGQKVALFSRTTISTLRETFPRPVVTTHSHSPLALTCTFNKISSLNNNNNNNYYNNNNNNKWGIMVCHIRTYMSQFHGFDYTTMRGYLVITVQSCRTLSSRTTPFSGLLRTIWPLWRQCTAVTLSTQAAVQWNGNLSPLNTTWRSEGNRNRVCSSKGPSGKDRNMCSHP